MLQELLTFPMDHERLREEFEFVIGYMISQRHTTCRILFGYAWGNDYYPGDRWDFESVSTADVVALVSEVESRGKEKLGSNDLFVEFPEWTFRFCNDSDIHMQFRELSPTVDFFRDRWERIGFRPAIWPVRDSQSGELSDEADPAG